MTTLLVSPLDSEHAALRNIFKRSNWILHSAFSCGEAVSLLQRDVIPVVVANRALPDGTWRTLIDQTQSLRMAPRVIVSSRDLDEPVGMEVLFAGGYDLLAQPWKAQEVLRVIALAWRSYEFACRVEDSKLLRAASATRFVRSAAEGAVAR